MKVLSAKEAAGIIKRFITGTPAYPQEWNDFIEGRRVDKIVEPFKKRCYELDPLVNRPGESNSEAMSELARIADELASK